MPVALVTGANGFIGSNLVRHLQSTGWQVKGLVLKDTPLDFLHGLDLEVIPGDVTQPETLVRATRQVEVIFHLAALARDWGAPELFFRINAGGTLNLLTAAVKSQVRRFILVSSVAVHQYGRGGLYTEDSPPDCPKYIPYGRSKIQAEQFAREYQANGLIEGVIVRPGFFVYGPNDLTSFYYLAQALERGRFCFVRKGRAKVTLAYVENLCQGLRLAATVARAAGETYIIADPAELTWKELISKICHELGVPSPRWSIPYFLAFGLAATVEKACSLARMAPPLTRYRANIMKNDLIFSADKAKVQLGYVPLVGLEEGIARTVAWYQKVKGQY